MLNEPVLVLNANYEPLNVCNTKRAVNLWLSGKAEMLLNGRGVIRTVRREIPRPSVIRLSYMVKRPYPRVRLSKKEIFRRDEYRCQYCGQAKAQLTLDHIIPRHRGGDYSWSNLVTACPSCNLKKGGRTLRQAGMRLLRKPTEPRATASYLYGGYIVDNSDWEQFLKGW